MVPFHHRVDEYRAASMLQHKGKKGFGHSVSLLYFQLFSISTLDLFRPGHNWILSVR